MLQLLSTLESTIVGGSEAVSGVLIGQAYGGKKQNIKHSVKRNNIKPIKCIGLRES